MSAAAVDVVDNRDAARFEVTIDGILAVLEYDRQGERLVLVHTEVPDAHEGQGVGSALVRAALEAAIAEQMTIVPACPFARSWLRKHPDDAGRASIDWQVDTA
jgi:uncharacterized protein